MQEEFTVAQKVVFTVGEFARMFHIGRNLAYELVRTGEVKAVRLGTRRVVIPRSEVQRLLLERAEPASAKAEDVSFKSAKEVR